MSEKQYYLDQLKRLKVKRGAVIKANEGRPISPDGATQAYLNVLDDAIQAARETLLLIEEMERKQ